MTVSNPLSSTKVKVAIALAVALSVFYFQGYNFSPSEREKALNMAEDTETIRDFSSRVEEYNTSVRKLAGEELKENKNSSPVLYRGIGTGEDPTVYRVIFQSKDSRYLCLVSLEEELSNCFRVRDL